MRSSRQPRPRAERRQSRRAASAWADPSAPAVPTVTLGKTGQKVTVLGMGTSWAVDPSFVQLALHSGVRYIDTSETYENGNAERVVGAVLERTNMRKDVYLVTKNSRSQDRRAGGLRRLPQAAAGQPRATQDRLHRLLLPPRRERP